MLGSQWAVQARLYFLGAKDSLPVVSINALIAKDSIDPCADCRKAPTRIPGREPGSGGRAGVGGHGSADRRGRGGA